MVLSLDAEDVIITCDQLKQEPVEQKNGFQFG